ARVDEIMEQSAAELSQQGYCPFIIPEGASNALGAFGYIEATREIAEQLRQMKINIDYLVIATGSGGTQAGLIIGRKLFNQSYRVLGINVCDDQSFFVNKIGRICNDAIDQYQIPVAVSAADIEIIDGYVGEGYALNRPQEIEFIREIAGVEGVIFDPVYTGKAMFGLREQILQARFRKTDNILFIHTGGLFGIFPKKELFSSSG
ncbi:MAG: pyridoxal-phosphate dependent enzyme, partial [bacterium]|nr:pyridoxal-phosphate dependent enzyme [bacterium]